MTGTPPRTPSGPEDAGLGPEDAGLAPAARAAILAWFDDHGRALAFRGTRDPYAILVSEVMAQQTQISRVVDAWARFLERFPTVFDLAASSPADVLRAWRGMGYDRRALNLRRAAQAIVAEHDGRVPRDLADLERLPGVGPYTARAVASIAYGARVGAVDTNVRRVLGRSVGGREPADTTPAWIQSVADASVDPDRPGDWTHALMDVGAMLCRPHVSSCERCPVRAWCRSAATSAATAPAAEHETPPAGAASHRARSRALPFTATTRWLRGRIVDRLRDVDEAGWSTVAGPIGEHDPTAVRTALEALVRDGILELDPADPARVRLATA